MDEHRYCSDRPQVPTESIKQAPEGTHDTSSSVPTTLSLDKLIIQRNVDSNSRFAGYVIICLIMLFLFAGIALAILEGFDLIHDSTGDIIMASVLMLVGIGSAWIGRRHRRKGNYELALTYYRVSIWCMFFAFVAMADYHRDWMKEQFIMEIKSKSGGKET
jgi:hypothetical protein